MKKLLTICLLLAITVTSQAQQKPTKEETVAFISRTVELSIGSQYNYTYTTKISFDYKSPTLSLIPQA